LLIDFAIDAYAFAMLLAAALRRHFSRHYLPEMLPLLLRYIRILRITRLLLFDAADITA